MIENLAGVAMDEGEAEIGGALTQAMQHALPVVGVVRGGPGVLGRQAVLGITLRGRASSREESANRAGLIA